MESTEITVEIDSQEFADFLKGRRRIIKAHNSGFFDVDVSIRKSHITIESGDADTAFMDAPHTLNEFMRDCLSLLTLERDAPSREFLKTFDALEKIEFINWSSKHFGLEGDDGRFDRSNYDPVVLSDLLWDIADDHDIDYDDVTDEMFKNHVSVSDDTVTESACFVYIKKDGKSKYTYSNGMTKNELNTDERNDYKFDNLSKDAQILKMTIDALHDDIYKELVTEYREYLKSVLGERNFQCRDEFSAALAEAFNMGAPFFFDNYMIFVSNIKKRCPNAPVLTEAELISILDGNKEF